MNNYFEVMQSSSLKWNKQFSKWLAYNYLTGYESILDLGCGKGELVNNLKELGFKIEGYDYPEVDLENTLSLSRFKNGSYDVIVLKQVIEHIRNYIPLMNEIYRILKPKGKLIIFTDDVLENFEGFLDDPTHISLFTKERLKNLALMTNFKIIKLRYWRNLPFIWRYTLKAFDYTFPKSRQILGVFER